MFYTENALLSIDNCFVEDKFSRGIRVDRSNKSKKSLFSRKGDSEDFDYLKHQVWFTIAAAAFFFFDVSCRATRMDLILNCISEGRGTNAT